MEHKRKRWLKWPSKKGVDREFQRLQNRIEQSPDDPRLHQRLAEFYLDRGEKSKAVEEFTKAAECHCEAGFYLRAIALYRRILRMQGESTKVLLKLGELYLINGLLGDALVHFQKVILQHRKKGNIRGIPSVLKRMVDVNPENLEVRAKSVELLRAEGFMIEALDELILLYSERKEKGSPEFIQRLEGQIRTLYSEVREKCNKEGDQQKLSDLEDKIRVVLEPQDEVSPAQPAQELEAPEEAEVEEESLETLELANESRVFSDEDIQQQLHEAGLYMDQGLFDEAETIFEGVLEADPNQSGALQGLEDARRQREQMMGKTDASIAYQNADQLVENTHQSSEAPDGRHEISDGTIDKPPDDARVRFELGLAYRELELIDECIEELLIAVQDPSMAFVSHRELGVCYLQKGNLDEAIKHFREAISCQGVAQDKLLEVSYELAQLLEQRGQRQQALSLFQKIEEKDQTFRDVRDRVKSLIQ